MSDWWARKLAEAQPQAPAPFRSPPVAPVRPPAGPVAPPGYYPPPQAPVPVQRPQEASQEVHLGDMLAGKTYDTLPRQAMGQRDSTTCPGCGSGNYVAIVPGTSAKGQCTDCGYPLIQAGSGLGALGGARASGPAQMAAQPTYDANYSKGV